MTLYHFSILIRDAGAETEGLEDRLFEAGCGDALVCFAGRAVYLEFDREAESARAAVDSAMADIRRAGFADLVLQESGYATLAEMAARSGLSRAALSNYANGRRGAAFPAPVYGVAGGSALYSWREVAAWLYRHNQLQRPLYEVAQV
ncbi:XRE family transcriptional regulator [Neisseria bergeri]|uniref:XRE family transcriptional regulator n=1 Tax=Neisseria bergeri TaxID=1906581 RepID=UPI0027E1E39B|nr:XRE family transcriptional regulator [Neisseria bergeri]